MWSLIGGLVFGPCNSPFAPDSFGTFFMGFQSSCMLLSVLSFGILPHASLGDKDAGPAFSRENVTWVPYGRTMMHIELSPHVC